MAERVDQALAWARGVLAGAAGSEPLDASILLKHVLGIGHTALLAHPERLLSREQVTAYQALIERRAAGEPVAYLTGKRAFYDRDWIVTPAVLIPRPETEHLIEVALAWAQDRKRLRIVDVGTGSGIIAVTLAVHLPGAAVWAVDISGEALEIARQNAEQAGVLDRLTLMQGDLLAPLRERGLSADLIVANLPYIGSDTLPSLAVAHYEPHLALDGGPDGLALIRRLFMQAPEALAPGGLFILEIGGDQGERVRRLAQSAFPGASIQITADYAGHDRVVWFERS